MQRIPIADRPNPTQPYDLTNETICFGKAWDPTNATCKNCKSIHACGTKQFNTNLEKQDQIKNGTPFLSECSFEKVDEDVLLEIIRLYLISEEKLLEEISNQSGFKDKVTLTNFLNQFISRHNLTIEDGIIK